MILFHGTTKENATMILSQGFNQKNSNQIWQLSEKSMTYWWKQDIDGEHFYGFERACESALLSMAISGIESSDAAVICLDIPEIIVAEYFKRDSSIGASKDSVCVPETIINKLYFAGSVKTHLLICDDVYVPELRYFYLLYSNVDFIYQGRNIDIEVIAMLQRYSDILCVLLDEIQLERCNNMFWDSLDRIRKIGAKKEKIA